MKKLRYLSMILAVVMLLGNMAMAVVAEETSFAYRNDPRDNPEAMKDIVENPDAVYGFSPNPDSPRLGEFADAIDWTDPDQVAGARAQRQEYHDSMSELYRMIEDMLAEARPVEEIARAVSQRRNELRLEAYADDPCGLYYKLLVVGQYVRADELYDFHKRAFFLQKRADTVSVLDKVVS